jgi:hypothetical protein
MKLQIRDALRMIAYPQTTSLTAPVKNCDTKGAKKRKKSARSDSSTTRSPSYWEHIDSQFPDSQASQSKPLRPRRKTARIGHLSPIATPAKIERNLTCNFVSYDLKSLTTLLRMEKTIYG